MFGFMTVGGTPREADAAIWLSAPERAFAEWMRKRQRTHRTSMIIRSEATYGPQGMRLLSAAVLLVVSAALIGFAGLALALGSLDEGAAARVGNVLLVLAVIAATLGGTRAVQAAMAGRRFRSL
jgi:hypothetical protein